LPKDPIVLEHLATVLELLPDPEAALAAWGLLLKVDPTHAEAKRKVGSAANKAAGLDGKH
jgi:hypothetical protein